MDVFDQAAEVEDRDRARAIAAVRQAPYRDYERDVCRDCSYVTKKNFGKRCDAWAECLEDLQKRERAGR